MQRFTIRFAAFVAALLFTAPAFAQSSEPPERPLVQMAILLDTSGSMNGLIDQARTQLWNVVNELATARRQGAVPILEVALYEYGNSGLSASEGWLRQITPLTDDLDAVSEALFALTTNGGDEYCGRVIQAAVNELVWSTEPDVLRMIYIAGNEPFTQGPVDYRESVRSAVERGITVNTIHCGDEVTGRNSGWADGARLADGAFLSIDQNQVVPHIEAPQDAEIARLGVALNDTYLAYGHGGAAGLARQTAQDGNAAGNASSAMNRAVSKASALYHNAQWDLVDATNEGKALAELTDDELPEEMKGMSPAERETYVAEKAAERAKLQEQIRTLNDARNEYVAKKRAETAGNTTLGEALVEALRAQAQHVGLEW